jgi:hypothetical protein
MALFGHATAFSVPFVGPVLDAETASITVAARWKMPDIPSFYKRQACFLEYGGSQ